MNTYREQPSVSLYSNRSSFKWVVLGISLIISAGSIIYTDQLVKQIREREKKQIDLYARTLEYLTNESDAPNQIFILEEIIQANNTIPVILTNEFGEPEYYRNLPKADNLKDAAKGAYLREEISNMKAERDPILVTLVDDDNQVYGYKHIYYKSSYLLVQLRYYPYVQLSIIAIFGLIIFTVFNYSRTAEQNRVWVGMAKETAHQLGTPLSSLIAWVEYFKETFPDHRDIFLELQKDVDRLEMITERFSNIGSVPQMREENMYEVVRDVISYLEVRISKKVAMTVEAFPNEDIGCLLNKPLFAWVIENIIKNAVDAMEGKGRIDIRVMRINHGQVAVDISDTGKGIAKHRVKQVFKPGFTTKKRGWGLGLALTKRIVENYHGGKIFVKHSEVDKGTTFRILLKT
ncbi:sensor histidine kinase [Marinoscillum furvescens]|uniref:histidine kinase n=1 Tax=Marinoscillum furvescens DSM 4134 TaxID=1122208 RepID=A0A3D9LH83_MARFU|nr:HAMP domain-containing sensor histidine kinase [Marinoscillum furvescens]REE05968.1 histidine kinase/DNA gyrase B/HSP90-like ATPase [Marinoscillum furvescens DSM 4134]